MEFLANVVRLYRGDAPEFYEGNKAMLAERFPGGGYADLAGLCKAATLDEIEAQGWSLNPGRYVGVGAREPDEVDFVERLEELNEELEQLNAEGDELQAAIGGNVAAVLEQAS